MLVVVSIIRRSRRLSSSASAPASMPNTARVMTSSVIACMCGRRANGRPTGQVSMSRSAASRMIAS